MANAYFRRWTLKVEASRSANSHSSFLQFKTLRRSLPHPHLRMHRGDHDPQRVRGVCIAPLGGRVRRFCPLDTLCQ